MNTNRETLAIFPSYTGDSEAAETTSTTIESTKEPDSRPSTQKPLKKVQRSSSQGSRAQAQRGQAATHQKSEKSQQPRYQARSAATAPKTAQTHDKPPRSTASSATDAPVGGAVLGTRRPGLLVTRASATSGQPASVVIKKQPAAAALASTTSPKSSSTTAGSGVIMLHQRRVNPSNYIIRPSTSESEPALVVPTNLVRDNAGSLFTPNKRGRPSVAMSMAKRYVLHFCLHFSSLFQRPFRPCRRTNCIH